MKRKNFLHTFLCIFLFLAVFLAGSSCVKSSDGDPPRGKDRQQNTRRDVSGPLNTRPEKKFPTPKPEKKEQGEMTQEPEPESSVPVEPLHLPIDKMENLLFDKVNQARKKNGLSPLKFNRTAYQAAKSHSADMARRDYFAHESPDGVKVTGRLKRLGFEFGNTTWGENIAMNLNYPDPVNSTLRGWLKSPGHYENIMKKKYTHSGIGIAKAPDGKYYYTQVFWGKL